MYSNGIVELTEKALELRNSLIKNKSRTSSQKVFEQVRNYLGVSHQDKLVIENNYEPGEVVNKDDFDKALRAYLFNIGSKRKDPPA